MGKVKKVFTSFGIFFAGMVSKVLALDLVRTIENKYVSLGPISIPAKYGVLEPTIGEKISIGGKIGLSLVLFIIGLFVILSKKVTKKVKGIIIAILLAIGILSWIVLNYVATNY